MLIQHVVDFQVVCLWSDKPSFCVHASDLEDERITLLWANDLARDVWQEALRIDACLLAGNQ